MDRRLYSHFLILLVALAVYLPASPAVSQTCLPNGDINQDGNITASDALLAFQHALGVADPPLNSCQLTLADVYPVPTIPDGRITASDALCIFQKALSLPSCLDLKTPKVRISGGTYNTGDLPEPTRNTNSPVINNVKSPPTLINGGSAIFEVETGGSTKPEGITAILVKIKGTDGYFSASPQVDDEKIKFELSVDEDYFEVRQGTTSSMPEQEEIGVIVQIEADGNYSEKFEHSVTVKEEIMPVEQPDVEQLFEAVISGNLVAVNNLIEAGADLNIQHEGSEEFHPGTTLLHLAAALGHTDIAIALIEAGAKLNIQTEEEEDEEGDVEEGSGETPLHWAADAGHAGVAIALIEAGADLNIQDPYGWTPLHLAANARYDYYCLDYCPPVDTGYTDIVIALIEAGADLNIRTNNLPGETPLDVAEHRDHTDAVHALKARGALCNLTCKERSGNAI